MYRIVHCSVIVVQSPSIEDRRYTLFWDRVSLHLDGDGRRSSIPTNRKLLRGQLDNFEAEGGGDGGGGVESEGGG